jgi:hypothetical protein
MYIDPADPLVPVVAAADGGVLLLGADVELLGGAVVEGAALELDDVGPAGLTRAFINMKRAVLLAAGVEVLVPAVPTVPVLDGIEPLCCRQPETAIVFC